ncbi:hypothetical protein BGX20_005537, partial [Mortierella sp. AD010]
MTSKAEFLRDTKASEPYHIIERFTQVFEIKSVEELIRAFSTALEELIATTYNTKNDCGQSQQHKRYTRWKEVVETTTFRAACAKLFSKKVAAEASAFETTLDLCCIVSGQLASTAFTVDISSTLAVAKLKERIKEKMPSIVGGANDLKLFRVAIPTSKDIPDKIILAKDIEDKQVMMGGVAISDYFEDGTSVNTIHIIIKSNEESLDQIHKRKLEKYLQYVSATKRTRILEGWREYKAVDGNTVELPPQWIRILDSTYCIPAARTKFAHLKTDLQVGTEIDIPSMGQAPKEMRLDSQRVCKLLVTKQMLDIWKEIRDGADGNENRLYKR